jgi:hypothetical protein
LHAVHCMVYKSNFRHNKEFKMTNFMRLIWLPTLHSTRRYARGQDMRQFKMLAVKLMPHQAATCSLSMTFKAPQKIETRNYKNWKVYLFWTKPCSDRDRLQYIALPTILLSGSGPNVRLSKASCENCASINHVNMVYAELFMC